MQLTATSLARMIDSLRSNAGEPGERRKQPRVGLRVKAEIGLPAPNGARARRATVWVRDVSAAGIGILSEHPFERGDTFTLLLGGADGAGAIACTVMNCRKVDSRLYGAGARFLQPQPLDNDP